MKENKIVKKIRLHLEREYGATHHKYHGSAYGERGHADIYGTLPTGRAYYIEVKQPETIGGVKPEQLAFLERERKNGALAGVAASIEDVDKILDTV